MIEIGKVYRLKIWDKFPPWWNDRMIKYAGEKATPYKTERNLVKIKEDGGEWYWRQSDFEEIEKCLNFEIEEYFEI